MPKRRDYGATKDTYAVPKEIRKSKPVYIVQHGWVDSIEGWKFCNYCNSAMRVTVESDEVYNKRINRAISSWVPAYPWKVKYATYHCAITGTVYEWADHEIPPETRCVPRQVLK